MASKDAMDVDIPACTAEPTAPTPEPAPAAAAPAPTTEPAAAAAAAPAPAKEPAPTDTSAFDADIAALTAQMNATADATSAKKATGSKVVNSLVLQSPAKYPDDVLRSVIEQSLRRGDVVTAGYAAVNKLGLKRSPWSTLFRFMSEDVGPLAWPDIAMIMLRFHRGWHDDVMKAARDTRAVMIREGTMKSSVAAQATMGYLAPDGAKMMACALGYLGSVPKSRVLHNAMICGLDLSAGDLDALVADAATKVPSLQSKMASLLAWTKSTLPPQSQRCLDFTAISEKMMVCIMAAKHEVEAQYKAGCSADGKDAEARRAVLEGENKFLLAALHFAAAMATANGVEEQRIKSAVTRPEWVNQRMRTAAQMDADAAALFVRLNGKGVNLYQEPIMWMMGMLAHFCARTPKAYLNAMAVMEVTAQELLPRHTALAHVIFLTVYQGVLDFDHCHLDERSLHTADALKKCADKITDYTQKFADITTGAGCDEAVKTDDGARRLIELRTFEMTDRFMDGFTIRGQVNGRPTVHQLETDALKKGINLDAWPAHEKLKSHGEPVAYRATVPMDNMRPDGLPAVLAAWTGRPSENGDASTAAVAGDAYDAMPVTEHSRMSHYLLVACRMANMAAVDPYFTQALKTCLQREEEVHAQCHGADTMQTVMGIARDCVDSWKTKFGRDADVPVAQSSPVPESTAKGSKRSKRSKRSQKSKGSKSKGSASDDSDNEVEMSDDDDAAAVVPRHGATSKVRVHVQDVSAGQMSANQLKKNRKKLREMVASAAHSGNSNGKSNGKSKGKKRNYPSYSDDDATSDEDEDAMSMDVSDEEAEEKTARRPAKKRKNNSGDAVVTKTAKASQRPRPLALGGADDAAEKSKSKSKLKSKSKSKSASTTADEGASSAARAKSKSAGNAAKSGGAKGKSGKKPGSSAPSTVAAFVSTAFPKTTIEPMAEGTLDGACVLSAPTVCAEETCWYTAGALYWGPFDTSTVSEKDCVAKMSTMVAHHAMFAQLCGLSVDAAMEKMEVRAESAVRYYLCLPIDNATAENIGEWLGDVKEDDLTKLPTRTVSRLQEMGDGHLTAMFSFFAVTGIPTCHRCVLPFGPDGHSLPFHLPCEFQRREKKINAAHQINTRLVDILVRDDIYKDAMAALKSVGLKLRKEMETMCAPIAKFLGTTPVFVGKDALRARVMETRDLLRAKAPTTTTTDNTDGGDSNPAPTDAADAPASANASTDASADASADANEQENDGSSPDGADADADADAKMVAEEQ